MNSQQCTLSTAVGRWSGLGPYYAMFPVPFAFDVVERYSKRGDSVLDPFAGRASSVYAAAALGRHGYGIEINAVGWLYGHTKLQPATKSRVMRRIDELSKQAAAMHSAQLRWLPPFFFACYTEEVLKFLLAARKLDWRSSRIDGTLMALILVHLHGKREQSLSNQMRQGKAMSPDYSIRWWEERKLKPPVVDPVTFLKRRVEWRYQKGRPRLTNGRIYFGDNTYLLGKVGNHASEFNLLFTSPPYYGITNYHYDQWLRLWMLGGPPYPKANGQCWERKFASKTDYERLLENVFRKSADMMQKRGVVYVRTDARPYTFRTTLECLLAVFKPKRTETIPRPVTRNQTVLFKNTTSKPGEIDIILML